MNERVTVEALSRPHLAPHRRLHFDKVRASWTVQAPERMFMLDDIAHAIVSRCDGKTTVTEMIDDLCRTYAEAPREAIAGDVLKLIQDFTDKGVMAL
jgi:pyrroloquinoline quinone biosynthesis protein D